MRDLDPTLSSELEASQTAMALLFEASFDSGDVYMWTGYGDLVYDSKTYTGLGNLIGVSEYRENQSLQADGISVSLSGVNSTLISLALTEQYQGRDCRILLASVAFDTSVSPPLTGVIGQAYPFFFGLMDNMQISDSGDSAVISLSAENILMLMKRAKTRRYTEQDQKQEYPLDKGLDFVAALQDKQIIWGPR